MLGLLQTVTVCGLYRTFFHFSCKAVLNISQSIGPISHSQCTVKLSTPSDAMLSFIVAALNLGCSDSLLQDSPHAAPMRRIVSTPSRSVGSHFAPSCHRSWLLPQCPRPFHYSVSTTKTKDPHVGGCVSYSREATDMDLTLWIP
jgi:hypothetical protein